MCMRYVISEKSRADSFDDYRDGGPTIFAEVKHQKGVKDIVGLLLSAWKSSGAYDVSLERWNKEGKKGSGNV